MKQYLDSSAHFRVPLSVSLIFTEEEENFAPKKSQRGPQTSLWPIKIFLVFLSFQGGRGRCLSVRVLNMPIVKVRTIRLGGRREDEQISSFDEVSIPWLHETPQSSHAVALKSIKKLGTVP